jgi:hypothetical protein
MSVCAKTKNMIFQNFKFFVKICHFNLIPVKLKFSIYFQASRKKIVRNISFTIFKSKFSKKAFLSFTKRERERERERESQQSLTYYKDLRLSFSTGRGE